MITGHKKLKMILFNHLCKYSCTFLSYKALISNIWQMRVEPELLDKHWQRDNYCIYRVNKWLIMYWKIFIENKNTLITHYIGGNISAAPNHVWKGSQNLMQCIIRTMFIFKYNRRNWKQGYIYIIWYLLGSNSKIFKCRKYVIRYIEKEAHRPWRSPMYPSPKMKLLRCPMFAFWA